MENAELAYLALVGATFIGFALVLAIMSRIAK